MFDFCAFQVDKKLARRDLEELEKEGLAKGWLGKGLRYLANGHQSTEAYKAFMHITSLFAIAYKCHQGDDHFFESEKSSEKILPTGEASVDKKNLTWMVGRSDRYAERLSSKALHSGHPARVAQIYRGALKLLEMLGFREGKEPSLEMSSRVQVTSFALSALYGLQWGHTCKKREIVEIYLRNFFWIFRKILG